MDTLFPYTTLFRSQVTSNGKTYKAEVSAVSPEVVNGEVNARLRFAEGQQPPGLRQNQRLSSRIVLDTRKNVLMVERGPFLEQRSEEHTSELQSLMRISYAVFCFKKKKKNT